MNNQQYQSENQQYQWWTQVMLKLEELQNQVTQLSKENEDLKLNIIAMSPAYSEDQRRAAMAQMILNEQEKKEAQQNMSIYK